MSRSARDSGIQLDKDGFRPLLFPENDLDKRRNGQKRSHGARKTRTRSDSDDVSRLSSGSDGRSRKRQKRSESARSHRSSKNHHRRRSSSHSADGRSRGSDRGPRVTFSPTGLDSHGKSKNTRDESAIVEQGRNNPNDAHDDTAVATPARRLSSTPKASGHSPPNLDMSQINNHGGRRDSSPSKNSGGMQTGPTKTRRSALPSHIQEEMEKAANRTIKQNFSPIRLNFSDSSLGTVANADDTTQKPILKLRHPIIVKTMHDVLMVPVADTLQIRSSTVILNAYDKRGNERRLNDIRNIVAEAHQADPHVLEQISYTEKENSLVNAFFTENALVIERTSTISHALAPGGGEYSHAIQDSHQNLNQQATITNSDGVSSEEKDVQIKRAKILRKVERLVGQKDRILVSFADLGEKNTLDLLDDGAATEWLSVDEEVNNINQELEFNEGVGIRSDGSIFIDSAIIIALLHENGEQLWTENCKVTHKRSYRSTANGQKQTLDLTNKSTVDLTAQYRNAQKARARKTRRSHSASSRKQGRSKSRNKRSRSAGSRSHASDSSFSGGGGNSSRSSSRSNRSRRESRSPGRAKRSSSILKTSGSRRRPSDHVKFNESVTEKEKHRVGRSSAKYRRGETKYPSVLQSANGSESESSRSGSWMSNASPQTSPIHGSGSHNSRRDLFEASQRPQNDNVTDVFARGRSRSNSRSSQSASLLADRFRGVSTLQTSSSSQKKNESNRSKQGNDTRRSSNIDNDSRNKSLSPFSPHNNSNQGRPRSRASSQGHNTSHNHINRNGSVSPSVSQTVSSMLQAVSPAGSRARRKSLTQHEENCNVFAVEKAVCNCGGAHQNAGHFSPKPMQFRTDSKPLVPVGDIANRYPVPKHVTQDKRPNYFSPAQNQHVRASNQSQQSVDSSVNRSMYLSAMASHDSTYLSTASRPADATLTPTQQRKSKSSVGCTSSCCKGGSQARDRSPGPAYNDGSGNGVLTTRPRSSSASRATGRSTSRCSANCCSGMRARSESPKSRRPPTVPTLTHLHRSGYHSGQDNLNRSPPRVSPTTRVIMRGPSPLRGNTVGNQQTMHPVDDVSLLSAKSPGNSWTYPQSPTVTAVRHPGDVKAEYMGNVSRQAGPGAEWSPANLLKRKHQSPLSADNTKRSLNDTNPHTSSLSPHYATQSTAVFSQNATSAPGSQLQVVFSQVLSFPNSSFQYVITVRAHITVRVDSKAQVTAQPRSPSKSIVNTVKLDVTRNDSVAASSSAARDLSTVKVFRVNCLVDGEPFELITNFHIKHDSDGDPKFEPTRIWLDDKLYYESNKAPPLYANDSSVSNDNSKLQTPQQQRKRELNRERIMEANSTDASSSTPTTPPVSEKVQAHPDESVVAVTQASPLISVKTPNPATIQKTTASRTASCASTSTKTASTPEQAAPMKEQKPVVLSPEAPPNLPTFVTVPHEKIVINAPFEPDQTYCHMKIKNTGRERIAMKLKSSNRERIRIEPKNLLFEPLEEKRVLVKALPFDYYAVDTSHDAIKMEWVAVPSAGGTSTHPGPPAGTPLPRDEACTQRCFQRSTMKRSRMIRIVYNP